MSESEFKTKLRKHFGLRPNLRMFNNPVGEAWTGNAEWMGDILIIKNPRRVAYGLAPGSYDLIGLHSRIITPDMVGSLIAEFVAWETKFKRGKESRGQENFGEMVRSLGGIAAVIRTIEDAEATLGGSNGLK